DWRRILSLTRERSIWTLEGALGRRVWFTKNHGCRFMQINDFATHVKWHKLGLMTRCNIVTWPEPADPDYQPPTIALRGGTLGPRWIIGEPACPAKAGMSSGNSPTVVRVRAP